MVEALRLLQTFAARMLAILQPLPPAEQREAMGQIAEMAESANLIPDQSFPTRESPEAFVESLLTENPAAADWLNLRMDRFPKPLALQDVPGLLDALGS